MKAADRRRLANALIRRGALVPVEKHVRRELGHLASVTTERYVRAAEVPAPADTDHSPEVP